MTQEDSRARFFAYCFDCDKEFGEVKSEFRHVRFYCPNEPKGHITSVLRSREWRRIQLFIYRYETRWTPGKALSFFRNHVGVYLIVRFIVVLLTLASFYLTVPCVRLIASIIMVEIIIDTLMVTTSVAFVSRNYSIPIRSIAYTLFSFVQLVIAFGGLYLNFSNDFNKCLTPWTAIYFSFVTVTTLGYGDLTPADAASHIQLMVMIQLMIGLYFLAVLVGTISAWGHAAPTGHPTHKLSDILREPVVPLKDGD